MQGEKEDLLEVAIRLSALLVSDTFCQDYLYYRPPDMITGCMV